MGDIQERIAALDATLFASIESQTTAWDRRALLALHEASATKLGLFNYLEIGSFRGGSLQVVMQDPRCKRVISIDSRGTTVPDKRTGAWTYEQQDVAEMTASLSRLPAADMSKLTAFDVGTEALRPGQVPVKSDFCFIDGEHTDQAVTRDARFCCATLRGSGIIAFHDCELVKPAIHDFLREAWHDVSYALAFTRSTSTVGGGVFALELGDLGILRSPVIDRAIASGWHSRLWRVANRQRVSAEVLLLAWSAISPIDAAALKVRKRWGQARRSRPS